LYVTQFPIRSTGAIHLQHLRSLRRFSEHDNVVDVI